LNEPLLGALWTPRRLPGQQHYHPEVAASVVFTWRRQARTIEQVGPRFAPVQIAAAEAVEENSKLLAMVLVNKFLHQPLNRQSKTYAREGIEIDVSTLADRVGACVVALAPIIEAIRGPCHERGTHPR
jgi:hypothetical protein